MRFKTIRFITILFVSLSMALSFAHLMQMAPRMSYDARLWRESQSMYVLFGPPIGALIDIGAVLLTIALVVVVRRLGAPFRWTLLAAIMMVLGHSLWWSLVNPVNHVMENWTVDTMPADWAAYRRQWEYAHAVIALIKILGLCALVVSLLTEPPVEQRKPKLPENATAFG